MSSSDHSPSNPETMKLLCASSDQEQPKNTEPTAAAAAVASAGKRGRKPGSSKTPKTKIPQRGMGVERLEQMRVQESLQQAAASGLVVLPPQPPATVPAPTLTPILPYPQQNHHSNIPVVYGAPSPHHVAHGSYGSYGAYGSYGSCGAYGLDQFPNQMIYGGNNNNQNNTNTFGVLGHHHHHHHQDQGPNFIPESLILSATAPGWSVPNNQHHHQLNRVVPFGSAPPFRGGSSLGTSKELSSIPNLLSAAGSESYAFGYKEQVFNENNARGSNVWRERTELEPWIRVAEDGSYYRKEPAELIAVHKNGDSEVFMEYEFFPGKYGRGTFPKELNFATFGSGEAGSSNITTVAADFRDTASNSIDLSLKLYH